MRKPRQFDNYLTGARRTGTAQDHYNDYFAGGRGPSPDELAGLRRQQAEFRKTEHAIARDNAWMLAPVAAPVAVGLGLGATGLIASRLAPEVIPQAPRFLQKDPYVRVGDNWATRAGRKAHAALKERVRQKQGWDPERAYTLENGQVLRPDVRTPARVRTAGKEPVPFHMEYKPNTPSGRAAAKRALKKYEALDGKTRAIFYDPKPFI